MLKDMNHHVHVIQHVHATAIKVMLLDNYHYCKENPSLRFFCSSLSKFVLDRYKYNRIFSPEFFACEIFNAKRALVLYRDIEYSEIEFFISCDIDYEKKDLACRLLVGNMHTTLVYAIGYCINLILNNGLNTLSFYVLEDNNEMLSLCSKVGMTEMESDIIRRRKYRTEITSLITLFRDYYNRFVNNLSHLYFQELIISGEHCYINDSLDLLKSFIHFSSKGFYFKHYDKSIYATHKIFDIVYNKTQESELDGILANFLQSRAKGSDRKKTDRKKFLYAPTDLFIFPTFACNLRCRYCYSEATPHKNQLSLSNAVIGIDYIIDNAKRRKADSISLTFHGGGEPTVNIELVNKIVSYCLEKATENELKVNISASTNATIYNAEVKLFLTHCSSIQFSFDGTKVAQDLHRPLANNESSYQLVISNISRIHNDFPDLPFSIRSTVSQKSINEMQDSVRLFASLGASTIVFEPLLEVGRALENAETIVAPNIVLFADEFCKCKELGDELGVKVKSSGDALYRHDTFCGASKENCILTPDGKISTCVEVSDESDQLSTFFIIGQIENGKVKIDDEKVKRIQGIGRKKNPECEYCIAEHSCRGNCLTRTLRSNKELQRFLLNQLCVMQTRLVIDNMETLHSRNTSTQ